MSDERPGILTRIAQWLWRRGGPREPRKETVQSVRRIADLLRELRVPEHEVNAWVRDCWAAYQRGEGPPRPPHQSCRP